MTDQSSKVAGEELPVTAYEVYVAEHQNGYCVLDEDDAQLMDDCTNHDAEVTPLTPRAPAQALIDGLRAEVERLKPDIEHALMAANCEADAGDKARAELAALKQSMGAYDPARVERIMELADWYAIKQAANCGPSGGRSTYEEMRDARAALRNEVAGGAE